MAANNMEKQQFVAIPSVCLPRIWSNFDKNYVETVFIKLLGPDADGNTCVKRIDFLPRTDHRTGDPYWLVFVHFSEKMLSSEVISDFVERINDGGTSIIYDQENYGNAWWKVRPCTAKPNIDKTTTGPRLMTKQEEEHLDAAKARIKAECSPDDNDAFPPLSAN